MSGTELRIGASFVGIYIRANGDQPTVYFKSVKNFIVIFFIVERICWRWMAILEKLELLLNFPVADDI